MKNRWYFYYVIFLTTAITTPISYFGHAAESYSTYFNQHGVGRDYPTNVYWGDTHLHTNLSGDAYATGNTRLGPEEACRFARGGTVITNNGSPAQLRRPLDFIAVAEHAYNLGVFSELVAGNKDLLATSVGKALYERVQADPDNTLGILIKAWSNSFSGKAEHDLSPMFNNRLLQNTVWSEVIAKAEACNDPGNFTSFIAFEWTPSAKVNDLFVMNHRVVLFRDGADKAGQVLPFTKYNSTDPVQLWDYLSQYHAATGGDVLAIPHNANASNGAMFNTRDKQGQLIDREYASIRSRWEPIFEVTQIKGDSETHPLLSPNDEFAHFERLYSSDPDKPPPLERLQFEYGRSALKLGLAEQNRLGVNPFKLGLIGSTDSHTSLSGMANNNLWGGGAGMNKPPLRLKNNWRLSSSGYAAVWAKENTRASIFDAMKRKEVYASTGPRIKVRFFGGWDYQKDDAYKSNLALIGYQKGVPMGGDLTHAPKGRSPNFLIQAVKDPDGAYLDRAQVIKGWHDKFGKLHEKIYNVALSDNRKPNWRGKVKSVGSTVDIADASYTNTIGDPELAVVWQDPDFNKDELAFYYVRVLEIPTPRWTAYDAKYFNIKDIPEEVPMVTQERVYTSPIWYTPG